jgi:FkbM family methyltransferase
VIFSQTISRLLTKCGIIISRLDPLDTNQKFIMKLVQEGFQIHTIYDIGAYKGVWTNRLKNVLPNSGFYLFEANSAHENDLKNTGSEYFLDALWSSEERREWWSIGGTGDSLFKENRSLDKKVAPVSKSTRTLDSLISEHNLPFPELIKIDVQGAELEVLKGATAAAAHASIIILELPIIEYNIDAPKISQYLDYMKEIGFLPLELLEVHSDGKLLLQVDIGFAKEDLVVKSHSPQG